MTRARLLEIGLPLGALAASAVLAGLLVAARAPVETAPFEAVVPLVRVVSVRPEAVRLVVHTHGTVAPRTESTLVPEVAGRVEWLSPALAAGGFFEKGEPLIRLDRRDHEVRLRRAEASLAGLRSQAALARRTHERSQVLAADGLLARQTLDDTENAAAVAEAARREAEAALEQARRDLERTVLHAPFEGRVREKHVDVGQFVERGTPVARLYAVDAAEIRLPIRDADVAHLDLPLSGASGSTTRPEVILRATFAGATETWRGRIVRTEGEIDPKTRMVNAVARVDDPYGRRRRDGGPPLAVGMFVDAEILGRTVPQAVVLPRAALHEGNRVLVVTDTDRLVAQPVTVLRLEHDRVVLADELAPGTRVCVSPVAAFVDDMQVRTVEESS